eukprot:TRINITY_DN15079_c0_g1_i1.p3 TRINITY_DN15079_c0_g1~~TRINITY_DN15079_c0_g1_i1.p3  ORF type:complete len:148 (+),score=59.63 TRINITY_DN15079_c0_g1_i1:64-507(+)
MRRVGTAVAALRGCAVGARRWTTTADDAPPNHRLWQEVVTTTLNECSFNWAEHYGKSDTQLDHILEMKLLTHAFDEFDLNKNGVLERNEVQVALRWLGLDDSDEAVDHIFAVYDVNNDGVLQLDEWLEGEDEVFRNTVLAAFFKHCE